MIVQETLGVNMEHALVKAPHCIAIKFLTVLKPRNNRYSTFTHYHILGGGRKPEFLEEIPTYMHIHAK